MISITKPFLPPKEKVYALLDDVWKRNWLSNNGPLVNELELRLKDYLSLQHLLYLSNGTIALQIAIKTLGLKGEIITTPFSYVATTSSIVWEGCTPVFVDVDQDTLNIEPNLIESAITSNTSAILATHVYGIPCDMEAISNIAKSHNLKVIYDAAHCFGTKYKGKSIFEWGDISTTSFHATKLFHTVEGGAVFTQDSDLLKRMAYIRNFGHDGPDRFNGIGINGKNSEFHAAMGLVNLLYIDDILHRRNQQHQWYDHALSNLQHQKVQLKDKNCQWNHAYYPILLPSEDLLVKMVQELEKNWIYPRRYFYPILSKLDYVHNYCSLPIAEDASRRILCLPLYHDLGQEEVDFIARILLRVQNN